VTPDQNESIAATTDASRTVLVIDDDADIRNILRTLFERAGLVVIPAEDGRAGMRGLFEHRPDLVVLDLGLPDIDGLELISRIRDVSEVGVLVLSARFHEQEKVECFGAGADDYVTKPFGNAELLARVHALLRRAQVDQGGIESFDDGPLHIDLKAHTVSLDGEEMTLTPTDWALLVALVRHRGRILSPGQLLELAWHDPIGVGADRVKFAVLRLRRRLGWQDPATSPIEAVRGFGYRYRGTDALRPR
jgi:DNA-binding response OmpR family regulator